MKHRGGKLEWSTLPSEEASRTICCPTRGRWQGITDHAPGDLGRWLHSILTRFDAEGLAEGSRVVIGDQTVDCPLSTKVANIDWAIDHPDHPVSQRPEIFIQDIETRTAVALKIREHLRPSESVLENCLLRPGYAQSRIATELPLSGKVLSMDDDTAVPELAPVLNVCSERFAGAIENSQVLHSSSQFSELDGRIEMQPNQIGAVFEPLGRTVSEIRQQGLGAVPVSEGRRDTMHIAFERMLRDGESSRFSLDHADALASQDSGDDEIVAIAITEYGIPDFRTVAVVDATIANAGMPIEYRTIPAGESRFFAFRHSKSHVSSCLARNLRDGLDLFPWWFLTDDRISRQNPLRTVRTSYRSDNELVADLLRPLSTAIGCQLAYGQGVSTRVVHQPAVTGHRPDLPEQAAASLVGAMLAGEVRKLLDFDHQGIAALPAISDSYSLPRESVTTVFEQLECLASRCRKVAEVLTSDPNSMSREAILWCNGMHHDLRLRLAGFNLQDFKAALDVEARDQLRFYRDVLAWYPRIRRFIIDEMVLRNRYPVKRYVN